MSDRLTDSIEPFALATQGWTIEGKIPLANLRRLDTLVCATSSTFGETGAVGSSHNSSPGDLGREVEFTLNFDVDEGGVPHIGGRVSTVLRLHCQRCLEEMDYPITLWVHLGIVSSRKAAEALPENYDPLVVGENEISIASILEDELILALPIVAIHEIESCPRGGAFNKSFGQEEANNESMVTSQRKNPFAVLAQLKETQSGILADNVDIGSTNMTSSNKDEE